MVRNFKILNQVGQEFLLNDLKNYCFLNNPSGLGYEYSTEYLKIGNSFIQNTKEIQQGKISGELVFKSYENYKSFIDFIEKSIELKFVYLVPKETTHDEYYKDVDVFSIEKTEKGLDGLLRVPIVLNTKSLWYKEISKIYTLSAEANQNRWDVDWDFTINDTTIGELEVINSGHVESGFILEIDSYVENPTLRIVDYLGKEQQVIFNITIEEGQKLLFSTQDEDMYILLEDENGIQTNIINCLDFNNKNFIKMPIGKNTVILEENIYSAKLTLFESYIAV